MLEIRSSRRTTAVLEDVVRRYALQASTVPFWLFLWASPPTYSSSLLCSGFSWVVAQRAGRTLLLGNISMIFWICLWSWVSCHQAIRRDQAALGILHQGACHLSARTRIVSVAPGDNWDFFGSTWPSASSALWAVTIVFVLLEKGVALRRLLYVLFDFGFLSSATVVILTTTHRTTPWICQSIGVLAAESCGSSYTRSTYNFRGAWKLFYIIFSPAVRLEPILRSPLQMITPSSAWSTTFTAWHFTTAHSSLVQFVLCGVGARVSHH